MEQDIFRDHQATHAVVNYIFAAYQGRYAYWNALERLHHGRADNGEIKRCQETLDRAFKWRENLWQENDLFSGSWTTAQTFEANQALEYLAALKNEIASLADDIKRIISAGANATLEDLKLLAAAYARYAYARENYIQGLIEFGEKLKKDEDLSSYKKMLQAAHDELRLADMIIQQFQQPSLAPDFAPFLIDRCLTLPGTFRTHIHDINQIIAPYRGGVSFDSIEFTKAEADAWKAVGFGPVAAGYWRANEIIPQEAVKWITAGLSAPMAAWQWSKFGFTPESAIDWVKDRFPPAIARVWHNSGFTAAQTLEFMRQGINDPAKALELGKQG